MNNKTLSLAIAATSLITGTAMADYTGLDFAGRIMAMVLGQLVFMRTFQQVQIN